jgi:hypothetical protein
VFTGRWGFESTHVSKLEDMNALLYVLGIILTEAMVGSRVDVVEGELNAESVWMLDSEGRDYRGIG